MDPLKLRCEVIHPMKGTVPADEICEIFREALETSDESVVKVELASPNPSGASARALDQEGAVLAELQFDIMDSQMTRAAWSDFAGALRREIDAKAAAR